MDRRDRYDRGGRDDDGVRREQHRDRWAEPMVTAPASPGPVRPRRSARTGPGRSLPPAPVRAAVRVTGATAATVVLGCLTIAVPCFVSAVVGLCYADASTADAARWAAGCGGAAAVAAVPALVCHRLGRRPMPAGDPRWN